MDKIGKSAYVWNACSYSRDVCIVLNKGTISDIPLKDRLIVSSISGDGTWEYGTFIVNESYEYYQVIIGDKKGWVHEYLVHLDTSSIAYNLSWDQVEKWSIRQ